MDGTAPKAWSGSWMVAVAGGALAFPIAVLLHELGHFLAFSAFGFPDTVLRSTSVRWSGAGEFRRLFLAGDLEAAAAIAEPWQVAVGVAAGPIASYLLVIACVLAIRRFGPGPFSVVLGIGLVTPMRWLALIPFLSARLRGQQVTWNPDEVIVATLAGLPQVLVILFGVLYLIGCWFIVIAVPRGRRVRAIVPTFVGAAVVGGPLWVLWLGPWVLP